MEKEEDEDKEEENKGYEEKNKEDCVGIYKETHISNLWLLND